MQLRPRQAPDFPDLVRALRAVQEADAYPSVWPADPHAFISPPDTLGAWVAETGGQAVGQVLLRSLGAGPPAWTALTGLAAHEALVVSRLFVAPHARGQGVARALLRAAWTDAARRERRAILDVHTRNAAAIRVYEREGWRRVGTADGDWQEPGGVTPRVHVYVAPECVPAR